MTLGAVYKIEIIFEAYLSFVFDGTTEYAPFLPKTYKTVIFAQKPVFATLHTIYLKSAP